MDLGSLKFTTDVKASKRKEQINTCGHFKEGEKKEHFYNK